VSVYVGAEAQDKGLGKALLDRLISESETAGIWTLQAGIFPENRASLALHKSRGFRTIGTREKLGKIHGAWRDVTLLERRSTIVGV
jgi:phosphinothricin acetyltransferase